MDEPLLIGNNLAVLVAAGELARRGHKPTLLTDGKPLGGHFAGLLLEGHRFDLGMVLLEKLAPSSFGARLDSYDAHRRNEWTRFADRAADWLDSREPLLRTPTPQCLIDGRRVPDYLMANRLDAFHSAPVEGPLQLDRSDPVHASNKNTAAAYDRLNYADAASVNHGAALHAHFIEPFVRKLTGQPSQAFLARYHRAAWAPLFYPETLSTALRGGAAGLLEYPFWTTRTGCVGDLIAQTCEQMLLGDRVRVVTDPLLSMQWQGGRWSVAWPAEVSSSRRIALGVPVERARLLLGLDTLSSPLVTSITLMLCLVRADAIERHTPCLMVVDDRYTTYRLSDQDALAGLDLPWHRVVIEASSERLARSPTGESPQDILLRELCELMSIRGSDAVRVLKMMVARNALVLPTADAVAQAASAHDELVATAPHAELTGGLLTYGATSLNDQIVQGLKIAEEFE